MTLGVDRGCFFQREEFVTPPIECILTVDAKVSEGPSPKKFPRTIYIILLSRRVINR